LSPNGNQIAFSAGTLRKGYELFVINLDGSEQKQIGEVDSVVDLSWSPDGSKIVFSSDEDGDWEIYTINIDGTNLLQLTENNVYDGSPVWSPDGQQIVFESERDVNWEIYIMNIDGSKPKRITSNSIPDIDPSWSPDGTHIIYSSARERLYDEVIEPFQR